MYFFQVIVLCKVHTAIIYQLRLVEGVKTLVYLDLKAPTAMILVNYEVNGVRVLKGALLSIKKKEGFSC